MNNQMNDQDWDNVLSEWKESLAYLGEPKPTINSEPIDTYEVDYLFKKGKGTPKALFFVTRHDMTGTFGFWCPRSAIIEDDESEKVLILANWCKLTEIEYT